VRTVAEPRFQIQPLGLWDRPITDPRASSSRFRASWDDTIRLLLSEVDQLDGSLVVVQVDADPTEIRRDGMLRARARVNFPGVKVSFDSRHGPLTYATDAYEQRWGSDMTSWQANVRAIALALEALRAVDRYGVTHTGEQYRGWTALADKPYAHGEMTVVEAERVLRDAAGLPADASLGDKGSITAAYRIAARTMHPDAGGNADAFQLITTARDVLMSATGSRLSGGEGLG
jgi:hypothetical protein